MSRILLLCTVAILTNTDAFGQPPTKTPIVALPVTPTKPPSLRELAQRKRVSAEPKELVSERKVLAEHRSDLRRLVQRGLKNSHSGYKTWYN